MCLATQEFGGYAVGGVTFLVAFFNLWVMCVHPAFKDGRLKHGMDPYATYTGGTEEMAEYLRQHPELARKTGEGALRVAASNPQLARQAVAGAYSSQPASQPATQGGTAGSDNPFG